MLHGEVNLLEVEREQQAELVRQAEELAEKQRAEAEAAQRIAELEEGTHGVDEQYRSLDEEVDLKTRKLKKLFQTYKKVKMEIEDMVDEFAKDKESLVDDIRSLTQQIKLKNLARGGPLPRGPACAGARPTARKPPPKQPGLPTQPPPTRCWGSLCSRRRWRR